MRVALFATCVADTLFPAAAIATVTLLERLGIEVCFPEEQTCCGQMHLNAGYPEQAAALAARTERAFAGFEAVVAPSASCAAMVRHSTALPVHELSQFLVTVLGVEDVGAYYPHRVAYHPTCHSLRLLRVGDAPLRLLRAVRGLELVELAQADGCCGFGGTFAVKNADVSAAMLTDKLRAIGDSGAEVCTALDASCLMQIGGGLHRQRAGVRTVHLAEILASAEP
ncbi:MAG TPA: (Fe-S)-binding protein [Solirubrobacteraceae bacterium]|nr:(Fe-S)-binding protein [Solirubrobacteraceae bacterium]